MDKVYKQYVPETVRTQVTSAPPDTSAPTYYKYQQETVVGLKSDGTMAHVEVDMPLVVVPLSCHLLCAADTRQGSADGVVHCSSDGTDDRTLLIVRPQSINQSSFITGMTVRTPANT